MAKTRWRKIDVSMWGDVRFRGLSAPPPNGRDCWIHLLTNRETTSIPGVYRAYEEALARDLEWSLEGYREAFREVFLKGLAKADWRAGLVLIPNAIRHNAPESPNVIRSWRVHWDELPECALKVEAYQCLKAFVEGMGEGFRKAFEEALAKPSPNQEQEQEQDIPVPSEQGRDPVAPAAPPGAEHANAVAGVGVKIHAPREVAGESPSGPSARRSGGEQQGGGDRHTVLAAAARTSDETHQEALQREMSWATLAQGAEAAGSGSQEAPRGRRKRAKRDDDQPTAWPIAEIEILLVERCPRRVSLIRDGSPPYARVMKLGLQREAWEVLADWLAAGGEAWPAVKGELVTWSMLAAKGTDLLAAARAWAANGRGVPVPQTGRSRGAVRQHHMTEEQLADMKRLF